MGFNAQAQTGRGIPVDGFCGCAVPQPRQRPPPRPLQLPVTSAVEELCYLAFGDPFRVGNRLNENNEGQRVGCGATVPGCTVQGPGGWKGHGCRAEHLRAVYLIKPSNIKTK